MVSYERFTSREVAMMRRDKDLRLRHKEHLTIIAAMQQSIDELEARMSMGEPHEVVPGLAGYTENGHLIITTPSGVIFELKPERHTMAWAVIASLGRQSTTAESIVGMSFVPGDNPLWFARGYAQIIQRELNKTQE